MDLLYPVAYLEKSDFNSDGTLVPKLKGKPTFIMIQAAYCGHCQTAKPQFQSLAKEIVATNLPIACMTIQADGEKESERQLSSMLNEIYPDFRGFPSFILLSGNRRIPYTGGRTAPEMMTFLRQNLS